MKKPKKNPDTKKAKRLYAAKLRRKALKLWTEVVRLSGGNHCAVCGAGHGSLGESGKPIWLNSHHIEDKTNYSTRWDPKNGISLCPSCHKFRNPNSAHNSPVWFLDWLSQNRPGTIEYIRVARSANPHNALGWSLESLLELVASLEKSRAEFDSVEPIPVSEDPEDSQQPADESAQQTQQS